ncbi:hypothetical protein F2Q70_00037519 [Brassica cretica]|uniref:DUF4283 domain-containing protein n=1 Tax=Brassica cretica TaxID=69181 RepID=A0A8S9K1X4_BRACR|nr:hypothetical protein F2Q70_00037519 [Brassica cretica]
MLMLQRWEPVISNSFPNLIPFWVRIHGVAVNGLENLEMCLPLQLPSESKGPKIIQGRAVTGIAKIPTVSKKSNNEERRPGNSVHRSQSSRKRPPRTQRDPMNSSRSRDRRPALEAPPSPAQFEPPIELDRALALLGFASLSL